MDSNYKLMDDYLERLKGYSKREDLKRLERSSGRSRTPDKSEPEGQEEEEQE